MAYLPTSSLQMVTCLVNVVMELSSCSRLSRLVSDLAQLQSDVALNDGRTTHFVWVI